MCGIVVHQSRVQNNNNNNNIIEHKLKLSLRALNHRGPDAEGIYQDKNEGIYMGHKRLSIIDIRKEGNQPMIIGDRYVLIFNGEIYNYKDLKKNLTGDNFKTNSDTEVVGKCFEKYGTKSFSMFRGMFSICIWDKKERKLIVARDHIGIKPLFYTCDEDNNFTFSSEINCLKLWTKTSYIINENILYDYLSKAEYDNRLETLYCGIKRVEPGTFIEIKSGYLKISKWFDIKNLVLNKKESLAYLNEKEIEKIYSSKIFDAVNIACNSDVGYGVCLSGGVDSAVLAFIMSRISGELNSYTCSYEKFEDEENILARNFALKIGINHKSYFLPNSDIFDVFRKMISQQYEPIGGLQTISYYKMHELAKNDGIKVLLEGQGIDEMLCGYPYYKNLSKNNFLSINNTHIDGTYINTNEFLSDEFKSQFKKRNSLYPELSNIIDYQIYDIEHRKIPRVLRMNDLVSMNSSIELRVPFLDPDLLIFCLALENKYKIQNGVGKLLHRKFANQAFGFNIENQKKTIVTPQNILLTGSLIEEVLNIISLLKDDNRINYQKLKNYIEISRDKDLENSFSLWQMINYALLKYNLK